MKTHFTRKDYERALGSGSYRDRIIMEIFRSFFKRYTIQNLLNMRESKLDALVRKLSESEEARVVQDTIAEEVKEGEKTLFHISNTLFTQLQKLRMAPSDKNKIYDKPYQEVWAYCDTSRKRIAKGLFDPSLPLENIFFTPENTFYSDLSRAYRKGRLACEHGSRDIKLERVATSYVLRDIASDEKLEGRVRQALQGTADRFYGRSIKSREKRYETMEHELIDELYEMFKSLKITGRINYPKIYKIFEWMERENYDCSQFIGNPELRGILREEIKKSVPLPYTVTRLRVKQKESSFIKVLRAMYNLKDKNGEDKKFRDLYGIRVVLPDADDGFKNLYALDKAVRDIVGWEVEKLEDFINIKDKERKERGINDYRSLHIPIRIGDVYYELQIRTHKMDRDAEKKPGQSEDEKLMRQVDSLKEIPEPVKRIFAAMFGVRYPLYSSSN